MTHDGDAIRSGGDGFAQLGDHLLGIPVGPHILDIGAEVSRCCKCAIVDDALEGAAGRAAGEEDDVDAAAPFVIGSRGGAFSFGRGFGGRLRLQPGLRWERLLRRELRWERRPQGRLGPGWLRRKRTAARPPQGRRVRVTSDSSSRKCLLEKVGRLKGRDGIGQKNERIRFRRKRLISSRLGGVWY